MKRPYQIESQRAVKQLEQMAADGNPAVQMVLPMAEMIGWLRKGVGELIRQAGFATDQPDDGRGSARTGRRAQPSKSRTQNEPLGQGAGLLRGDGSEGADRQTPRENY